MVENLKATWTKVVAWWNKFTSKQKLILIGIAAAGVLVVAIMIFAFTRPQYVYLIECVDTAQAAEVVAILDAGGYNYRTDSSGLKIDIKEEEEANANIALGAEGFKTADYDSELFNNSFSTTESDKQKKWQIYLEKKIASDLENYGNIRNATVTINIPDQDGTLIAQKQDSYAAISLDTRSNFSRDQAAAVARAIATALGNDSTANITITDLNGNLLFSGAEDNSSYGLITSQLEAKTIAEEYIESKVKSAFIVMSLFDDIEVASSIVLDPTARERIVSDYSVDPGREEGYSLHEEYYNSKNSSESGGIPGTTANETDDTTYLYEDQNNTNSSESQQIVDRQLDSDISTESTPAGEIDYKSSSLALTAIQYADLHEEDAKRQGLLDGTTWEDYKFNNRDIQTPITVEDSWLDAASTASGFPVDNIAIVAYQRNRFFDAQEADVSISDITSIVMFVVILALLAFVVFTTMRSRQGQKEEEELSVEDLLQSAPVELEELEADSRSETRKLVEKFVDENPEAVANLLRNWLQEDWG
ncbi:MAG: flagellar M-ring protein FliF [Lachnospiraceae bacterium]|jgi:flagellar M-ring protein FliF|nr:flagellar M-ring protein FliF [Lachnospiraceae bacterium]